MDSIDMLLHSLFGPKIRITTWKIGKNKLEKMDKIGKIK